MDGKTSPHLHLGRALRNLPRWDVNERSFAPFHATDRFINPTYMGDYDSLAGDFTQSRKGFIGAFQVIDKRGNPDVDATRFRVEDDDD